MLQELHIKNFAIIDELHLVLVPGFNVLTGETGAGKSILIDAVALLLGGRADITALRKGESRARVEGLFVLDIERQALLTSVLEREGLDGDSADVLWLSRELRQSGRTVARVNGRVVSLSVLREVAEGLVDVHGQSEHLSLLRVREHLNLLDRFAGLSDLRAEVAILVKQIQAVRRELKHLRRSERERMQRIDLLRFQVDEIQTAHLQVGERVELSAELVRLSNAEQLAFLVTNLIALLEDGEDEAPTLIDLLGQGQREMSALLRIDVTLSARAQVLAEVGYQLEDLVQALRAYLAGVEFNPKRLTWVEERLFVLRQLERKYGGSVADVLIYAQQAAAELETLEHSDDRIAGLVAQEDNLLVLCEGLCRDLSERRQAASVELSAGVERELDDLRMVGARLGVAFNWRTSNVGMPLKVALPASHIVTRDKVNMVTPDSVSQVAFDTTGFDAVEFLVAPNVGEGLKPMTRIASGGETARLMLALKTVLSRADYTPTLIFDEIDQGIGGRVGTTVGAKLWQLTSTGSRASGGHQVLCITHLPQLAGYGDSHFYVRKQVVSGRTATQVVQLEGEARLTELAQMLGTQGTSAYQGAVEILAQAAQIKQANT